mmetsp:Transcript_4028/g.7739  ORF Transcript_4028/g.7739 Transcript_4028/m.7739 type:complete len:2413 (+) Transcript_4028:61-7299(+)
MDTGLNEFEAQSGFNELWRSLMDRVNTHDKRGIQTWMKGLRSSFHIPSDRKGNYILPPKLAVRLVEIVRRAPPAMRQVILQELHACGMDIPGVHFARLWSAVLGGHNNGVQRWVDSLPLTGIYETITNRAELIIRNGSLLPSQETFEQAIQNIAAKSPPPLNEILLNGLANRGVFLPQDLKRVNKNDFSRLILRLARVSQIFQEKEVQTQEPDSENPNLGLDVVLPFHRYHDAPLHQYIVNELLCGEGLESFCEAYITHYQLNHIHQLAVDGISTPLVISLPLQSGEAQSTRNCFGIPRGLQERLHVVKKRGKARVDDIAAAMGHPQLKVRLPSWCKASRNKEAGVRVQGSTKAAVTRSDTAAVEGGQSGSDEKVPEEDPLTSDQVMAFWLTNLLPPVRAFNQTVSLSEQLQNPLVFPSNLANTDIFRGLYQQFQGYSNPAICHHMLRHVFQAYVSPSSGSTDRDQFLSLAHSALTFFDISQRYLQTQSRQRFLNDPATARAHIQDLAEAQKNGAPFSPVAWGFMKLHGVYALSLSLFVDLADCWSVDPEVHMSEKITELDQVYQAGFRIRQRHWNTVVTSRQSLGGQVPQPVDPSFVSQNQDIDDNYDEVADLKLVDEVLYGNATRRLHEKLDKTPQLAVLIHVLTALVMLYRRPFPPWLVAAWFSFQADIGPESDFRKYIFSVADMIGMGPEDILQVMLTLINTELTLGVPVSLAIAGRSGMHGILQAQLSDLLIVIGAQCHLKLSHADENGHMHTPQWDRLSRLLIRLPAVVHNPRSCLMPDGVSQLVRNATNIVLDNRDFLEELLAVSFRPNSFSDPMERLMLINSRAIMFIQWLEQYADTQSRTTNQNLNGDALRSLLRQRLLDVAKKGLFRLLKTGFELFYGRNGLWHLSSFLLCFSQCRYQQAIPYFHRFIHWTNGEKNERDDGDAIFSYHSEDRDVMNDTWEQQTSLLLLTTGIQLGVHEHEVHDWKGRRAMGLTGVDRVFLSDLFQRAGYHEASAVFSIAPSALAERPLSHILDVLQPNTTDIVTRVHGQHGTITDITTVIVNDLTNTSVKTQSSFVTGPRLSATVSPMVPSVSYEKYDKSSLASAATQAESQNCYSELWEQLESVRFVGAVVGNRYQRQLLLNTTFIECQQRGVLPAFRAAWFYHLAVVFAEVQTFKVSNTKTDGQTLAWEGREAVRDHIVLLYIAMYYWSVCLHQKEEEIRAGTARQRQNRSESKSKLIAAKKLLEKLNKEKEMFILVINRLRGRIYWLMLIHEFKTVAITITLANEVKYVQDLDNPVEIEDAYLGANLRSPQNKKPIVTKSTKQIKKVITLEEMQAEHNQRELCRIQLPKNGYNFLNGAVTPTSLGLEVLDPLSRRQYLPWLHYKNANASDSSTKKRDPNAPKFEEVGMSDTTDRQEGEETGGTEIPGEEQSTLDESASSFSARGFGDAELDLELFEKVFEKLVSLCRFREVHTLTHEVIQFHLDYQECVLLQTSPQSPFKHQTSGVRQWVRDVLDMLHLLFFITDPALDRLSLKHVTSTLFIGREIVLASSANTLIAATSEALVHQIPIDPSSPTPTIAKWTVLNVENGKIALRAAGVMKQYYLSANKDKRTLDLVKVDHTIGKVSVPQSCHFVVEDLGHSFSAVHSQWQTYIFADEASQTVYQSPAASSYQSAWLQGRLTIRMANEPRPGQLFSPVPVYDPQAVIANNALAASPHEKDAVDSWSGLAVINEFVDIPWLETSITDADAANMGADTARGGIAGGARLNRMQKRLAWRADRSNLDRQQLLVRRLLESPYRDLIAGFFLVDKPDGKASTTQGKDVNVDWLNIDSHSRYVSGMITQLDDSQRAAYLQWISQQDSTPQPLSSIAYLFQKGLRIAREQNRLVVSAMDKAPLDAVRRARVRATHVVEVLAALVARTKVCPQPLPPLPSVYKRSVSGALSVSAMAKKFNAFSRPQLVSDGSSKEAATLPVMVFAAEQLSMNLVLLLDMNPVDIVSHLLWLQPDERSEERENRLTTVRHLIASGQLHSLLGSKFIGEQTEECEDIWQSRPTVRDYIELHTLVEAFVRSLQVSFSSVWTRHHFLTYVSCTPRQLELGFLFREATEVLISQREKGEAASTPDLEALVTTSLSAEPHTANSKYNRIVPVDDLEFECLYAAYFAHFSAGHIRGMRETLLDINAGLLEVSKRNMDSNNTLATRAALLTGEQIHLADGLKAHDPALLVDDYTLYGNDEQYYSTFWDGGATSQTDIESGPEYTTATRTVETKSAEAWESEESDDDFGATKLRSGAVMQAMATGMAIVARSGHGDTDTDFDLDTASQGGTLSRGTLDRDWDDKFSGMHSTYIQPTPNGTLERPRNRVYQPGEEELPFPNESQGVQPQEGRYFSEEEIQNRYLPNKDLRFFTQELSDDEEGDVSGLP